MEIALLQIKLIFRCPYKKGVSTVLMLLDLSAARQQQRPPGEVLRNLGAYLTAILHYQVNVVSRSYLTSLSNLGD